MQENLLSAKELAVKLGVSIKQVRRLTKEGMPVRIVSARCHRYSLRSALDFIKETSKD